MTDKQQAMEAMARKLGHLNREPAAVPAEDLHKPEPAEIEKTKPNKYENAFMIDLMILKNSIAVRGAKCKDRLKKVNKYAWRDLRLLETLVSKIQTQLISTMPDSRWEYYDTIAKFGRYHLDIEGGPMKPERVVLISDKRLGAILDVAIEHECLTCLRDGREIENCPLRQTLLEVAPPTEILDEKALVGCEYRDVAGQLIRGEMVVV